MIFLSTFYESAWIHSSSFNRPLPLSDHQSLSENSNEISDSKGFQRLIPGQNEELRVKEKHKTSSGREINIALQDMRKGCFQEVVREIKVRTLSESFEWYLENNEMTKKWLHNNESFVWKIEKQGWRMDEIKIRDTIEISQPFYVYYINVEAYINYKYDKSPPVYYSLRKFSCHQKGVQDKIKEKKFLTLDLDWWKQIADILISNWDAFFFFVFALFEINNA